MNVVRLRRAILLARDRREALVHRLAARLPREADTPWCLVLATTALPGEEKTPLGLIEGFLASARVIEMTLGRRLASGRRRGRRMPVRRDRLGMLQAWAVPIAAAEAKRACLSIESALLLGRLIDVDVYGEDGLAVHRADLGFPAGECLLCGAPAWDCIRGKRHSAEETVLAVDAILGPLRLQCERRGSDLRRNLRIRERGGVRRERAQVEDGTPRRDRLLPLLADTLVEGARAEIDLTPKPGLVDRRDSGSHPDLTYEAMMRSCDLLARYYRELIALHGDAASGVAASGGEMSLEALRAEALPPCIAAGRDAEARMTAAIGANAHRGYIFASGLVILAACDLNAAGDDTWCREPERLRAGIGGWARAFFSDAAGESGPRELPGGRLRLLLGLGGVRAETESGLAAVIDDALPALRRSLEAIGDHRAASYLAMARLMQRVEDTTAIRRFGIPGLARLRRDGAELERILLAGEDPDGALTRWNEEYRAINLTMGGVADCLAVTLALHFMAEAVSRSALPGIGRGGRLRRGNQPGPTGTWPSADPM